MFLTLHLMDQKYRKNSNIVKYYYKITAIYSCDDKAKFLASFLQSLVSHDLLEIIVIF